MTLRHTERIVKDRLQPVACASVHHQPQQILERVNSPLAVGNPTASHDLGSCHTSATDSSYPWPSVLLRDDAENDTITMMNAAVKFRITYSFMILDESLS
jgi:hypothetical protein